MKILLKKTNNTLMPVYDSDKESFDKIPADELVWAEIKKARNYEFHKKFFALCKLGWLNSKHVEMPFDAYRKYATMKAGFYETYKTPKGIMIEAKSIAFDKMTEEEFKEVYNRVFDFIVEDTEATKEATELMIGMYL